MGADLGLAHLIVRAPYRVFPDRHGGHLYSAVYNVQLSVAKSTAPRTKKFEAIIDSGATRCVFHSDLAGFLGLILTDGVQEITTGISGPQVVWLHDVVLHIPGGSVKVKAAFQKGLPIIGLLGVQGFFEHFTVTFDSAAQECRLERFYHS
jgi:hypothetical protein